MGGQAETKACCPPDLVPEGSIPARPSSARCAEQLGCSSLASGWYRSLPPLTASHRVCRQVWWLRGEEATSATTGKMMMVVSQWRWLYTVILLPFGKRERPSQHWDSTSEGISRAVCCSRILKWPCFPWKVSAACNENTEQGRFLKSTSETKIVPLFLILWCQILSSELRDFLMFSSETALLHARWTRLKINTVEALQGLCPVLGHVIFSFSPQLAT